MALFEHDPKFIIAKNKDAARVPFSQKVITCFVVLAILLLISAVRDYF